MAGDSKLIVEVVLEPRADRQSFKKVEKESKQAGKKGADQFARGFKARLSTSLTGIRSSLTKVIAGAFVVKKGLDIFSNAVRGAAEFEEALLEITTILPKTEKLARSTVAELERFGRQYGSGATAQAKSYYQIISAGITNSAQALDTLDAANKLAVGGLADVGSAINILTDISNVFGNTATDSINSLFKTVQLGKTTIPELASALGFALAPAKNLGLELDTVNAALATLTTKGNTTSENVTQLTSLLSAFAKNAQRLGKEFSETAIKNRPFIETLELLQKRTKGSSTALFNLLGRKEAVTAFLKLSGDGFKKLNANLADFGDKGTAASDAFKLIERSSAFQLKVFNANIASLQKSLGEILLPVINKVVGGFNSISAAINKSFLKPEDKTRLENLNDQIGRTEKAISAINNTVKNVAKERWWTKVFEQDDFVLSGKAAKRLVNFKKKLRELNAERAAILKDEQNRNTQRENFEKAQEAAAFDREQDLVKAKTLGFTKIEQLQMAHTANMKALRVAYNEGQIATDGEYFARRAVLEGQFNEQLLKEERKIAERRAGFFELLQMQSEDTTKNTQKDMITLAKTSRTMLARGIGRSFESVGKALRNNEDAWQAFKDGLLSVAGDIAGAVGDLFIKWGVANLVSGNVGVGAAQIAAGGALKILAGMIGADVQSRGTTGGSTATNDNLASVASDDSGILEDQQPERQTQQAINITVEGSLVQQEELGEFISNVISESNEKNGNVILNPRFA